MTKKTFYITVVSCAAVAAGQVYAARPVARWDVVPHQRITGVLNCVIDPGDLAGAFKDYANGDYTPNPAGPLYNAGVTPEIAPSVDLAGKKRVQGKSIDIGSFEALPTGLAITIR